MIIIITVIITHLALVVFVVHELVMSCMLVPSDWADVLWRFFLPNITTLMMFMQVWVLFVVLVFQCGRLPPGTHWCRIRTCGGRKLERGNTQKPSISWQLDIEPVLEDEGWHTPTHTHTCIFKSHFFRCWILFQTFHTLTMHSETILQNSVWNSEERLIYLLRMKESFLKVFTLLVFPHNVFIRASCSMEKHNNILLN